MKNKIISFFIALVAFCACWPESVPVTGITLDTNALSLEIGATYKLEGKISPSNATNQVIIWSSGNASIARVVSDGTVTALATGTTEIVAKSDDGGLTAVCTVTVAEDVVPVESLTIDASSLIIQKGKTALIKATVKPENATNQALRWKSTDDSVATVSENGEVVAVAPGPAIIVVSTVDGGFSAECAVTVEQKAEGLELSAENHEMYELEQFLLTARIIPEDSSDKTVEWTTSNDEVARVTSGVVNAVRAGKADITATVKSGDTVLSKVCHLEVKCKASSVSLDRKSLWMNREDSPVTLVATVHPDRTTDKSLTWSVEPAGIVDLSQNGTVTPKSIGAATVTVSTAGGEKKASCSVRVVSGLSVSPSELNILVGEEGVLTAAIAPSGESIGVKWSSSNPDIATVDERGRVKGLLAGKSTICATALEGGMHATCELTVRNRVESLTIVSPEGLTDLYVGKTANLSYKIEPADVKDVKIVWTSSDPSAATVDSRGVVTAKSRCDAGVFITASTDDGFVTSAPLSLKVIQQVTGIKLLDDTGKSISELTLWEGEPKPFRIVMSPDNANDKSYVVASNGALPESLVSISDDGKITAKKAGYTRTATLSFYPTGVPDSSSQPSASCVVTVHAHVSGLSFNNVSGGSHTIGLGTSFTPSVAISPNGAHDKSLTWSSSKPEIASINPETGVIQALSKGETVITAKSIDNPEAKASFTLIVKPNDVTAVKVIPSTLSLVEGEEATLTATVEPDDVADKSVIWTSGDTAKATVDANSGHVKAIKEGQVTITATSKATPSVSSSCTVTITHKVVHVTGVKIVFGSTEVSQLTLTKGDNSKTLKARVEPEEADDREYTWSSSKPSVATINNYGQITPKDAGETDLTVTTKDGGFSATCHLTVTLPEVPVESISISGASHVLEFGNTMKLTATVSPSNATSKSVVWSSENTSIAAVDDTGLVSAGTQGGTTNIVAKSKDYPSVYATYSVEVKNITHVSSISINKKNVYLFVGESEQLQVNILPDDADEKGVTWSIAQGGVAVISQTGVVTGVKPGQTTVYATAVDNQKKTSCVVDVTANRVASIELNQTNLVLRAGESFVLVPDYVGQQNPNKPVSYPGAEWKSDAPGVASVDSSGRVIAVSPGETDIIVRSTEMIPKTSGYGEEQSKVTATCHVKILPSEAGNGGNEGVEFDDWNF